MIRKIRNLKKSFSDLVWAIRDGIQAGQDSRTLAASVETTLAAQNSPPAREPPVLENDNPHAETITAVKNSLAPFDSAVIHLGAVVGIKIPASDEEKEPFVTVEIIPPMLALHLQTKGNQLPPDPTDALARLAALKKQFENPEQIPPEGELAL